jgi:hypothetical protein
MERSKIREGSLETLPEAIQHLHPLAGPSFGYEKIGYKAVY